MPRSCPRLRASCSLATACRSEFWVTIDWAMTSSPTRSMRPSSLAVSTRIRPAVPAPALAAAGGGSGAGSATTSGVGGGVTAAGGGTIAAGSAATARAGGTVMAGAAVGVVAAGCCGADSMPRTSSITAATGRLICWPTRVPSICTAISSMNCLKVSAPARIASIARRSSRYAPRRAASSSDSSSWASRWMTTSFITLALPLNV